MKQVLPIILSIFRTLLLLHSGVFFGLLFGTLQTTRNKRLLTYASNNPTQKPVSIIQIFNVRRVPDVPGYMVMTEQTAIYHLSSYQT